MPENRKRNVTLTIRVTPGEKDAILPLYSPFSFSAGFVIPVPATVDIHPDGAGEIADEGFDSFIGETHYEPYQTWQIPPEYS